MLQAKRRGQNAGKRSGALLAGTGQEKTGRHGAKICEPRIEWGAGQGGVIAGRKDHLCGDKGPRQKPEKAARVRLRDDRRLGL